MGGVATAFVLLFYASACGGWLQSIREGMVLITLQDLVSSRMTRKFAAKTRTRLVLSFLVMYLARCIRTALQP